jgi:DNA-binding transcriptional regulator of glucitol operon
MDKRVWLSRRALKLHAVILVLVPAFMALCIWQITRALGGNSLSWAYVFEWPIFAGYAVYMWWRFVHEAAEDTQSPPQPDGQGAPAETEAGAQLRSAHGSDEQGQDADLAAYNAYLAQLAERDKATGR